MITYLFNQMTLKNNKHIHQSDIVLFFRQFSTLLAAGIPIIQICEVLEKNQDKTSLRLLIYSIKRELLSGKTLFFALSKLNHHFDEMIIELIMIGEQTGKLEKISMMIAAYLEKKLTFQRKLKEALFYPALISCCALVMIILMFIFVVPRFEELFGESKEKLPFFTLWIFYSAEKIRQYIHIFLIMILLVCIIFIKSSLRSFFTARFLQFISVFPFINFYYKKILLARFARNLALTFSAGIPIMNSLQMLANHSGGVLFSQVITNLKQKIKSGFSLNESMQELDFFPTLMLQMVKIGEESGSLELMLEKTADFFEMEIEQFLHRTSKLLEPLIILVLGVLIGGLVIGMYLPIFKLGSVL